MTLGELKEKFLNNERMPKWIVYDGDEWTYIDTMQDYSNIKTGEVLHLDEVSLDNQLPIKAYVGEVELSKLSDDATKEEIIQLLNDMAYRVNWLSMKVGGGKRE